MIELTYQQIGLYFLSAISYIVILAIIYGGVASFKFHRIFYERDPRWSNYRSLNDTVSDTALICINLLITFFSILFMVFCCLERNIQNITNVEKQKEVLVLCISYGVTLGVTALIIAIMKILFTEPRPAMFYLCNYQGFRDAVDSGNFTSYYSLTDANNIGNTANCWDKDHVPDCIYSFPSGHSAISFCSMFWLVLFFVEATKKSKYAWMRYFRFVLWFPLLLAFYIAYSRVYDYKHSELDILTGCLIGVGCAYHFFYDYIDFFRFQQNEETKEPEQLIP